MEEGVGIAVEGSDFPYEFGQLKRGNLGATRITCGCGPVRLGVSVASWSSTAGGCLHRDRGGSTK